MNRHRLENGCEKFIPELIALKNRQIDGLNLRFFKHAKDFAAHLSDRLEDERETREIERAILRIKTQLRQNSAEASEPLTAFHFVTCETTFSDDAAYIRVFDSIDLDYSKDYYDHLVNEIDDVNIENNMKLIWYSLGLQKGYTGCDIFSMSNALKSHKWEVEGHTLEDFEDSEEAYCIKEDLNATFIPPYFYKHANSEKTITNIYANPLHEKWVESVNKKLQSLSDRHGKFRRVQEVVLISDNAERVKKEKKESSVSIDHKRYSLLTDLRNEVVLSGSDEAGPSRSYG